MNRTRILGVGFVILVVSVMLGLPIVAMFFQPGELEALSAASAFIDAVEKKQMEQAWDMLAPEAQSRLNQATFLRSQGDVPAVIQEFRNADIDLGFGPFNGLTSRGIGIMMNNPPPKGIEVVVTYHDGAVVISNIWDGSQP